MAAIGDLITQIENDMLRERLCVEAARRASTS